jgi:hypothetical protein
MAICEKSKGKAAKVRKKPPFENRIVFDAVVFEH